MLLDKAYYDYDYEFVEKTITYENTLKSDEEVARIAARFGFGSAAQKKPSEMDIEDLQKYAMNEEEQQ